MGTSRSVSVSLPPKQLKAMERTARKEDRSMSEFVGELYKRYVRDEARHKLAAALKDLRAEAARTPAAHLTMRQIDAEIAAVRRARRRKPPAR